MSDLEDVAIFEDDDVHQDEPENVGSRSRGQGRGSNDLPRSASGRKKRQLTSNVWNEFDKRTDPRDGKEWAYCHHCNRRFTGSSNSRTSHLKNHLKACAFKFRALGEESASSAQSRLKTTKTDSGATVIQTWRYNQERTRKLIAKMIVKHELPLCFVEYDGFREVMEEAQPQFKPFSRYTVRCDIINIYGEEMIQLMELLKRNKSRVALTTDMWTCGTQSRGYMAITAHFVDNDWRLQNRLLTFVDVPTPHTAKALVDILKKNLAESKWNIHCNLSSITYDNCASNDSMIKLWLEDRELDQSSLLFEGKFFHMRCSAHILNLIVKKGLDVISSFIENVRMSVSFWTSTPKRWETFEHAAKISDVVATKLVLDCKTRWNSTYLMLRSALPYKNVFATLGTTHSEYDWIPSNYEWSLATDICERLKVFYDVTELFSGSKYPTSSLFFPKICHIRTEISKWMGSHIPVVRSMAERMRDKMDKYWYDIHGLLAVVAILDPRFKMRLVRYHYVRLFGEEEGKNKFRMCINLWMTCVVIMKPEVDEQGLREFKIKEKMLPLGVLEKTMV